LSKLLGDYAPASRREQKFENYFGRKIAVDASMHIYQFLVSKPGAFKQSLLLSIAVGQEVSPATGTHTEVCLTKANPSRNILF
jgi:XPG N-terminal domain